MSNTTEEFDICPKCQQATAQSQLAEDGERYFTCRLAGCDFSLHQDKQDMSKVNAKLAKIKSQLFGG